MNLTRRQKRLGILGAAGLAGATALAIGIPAFADNDNNDNKGPKDDADTATVTVHINEDHVGEPATYFEEGCGTDSQLPEDLDANEDGWVFVLPGGNDTFVSVTVTFADEEGGEHVEQGTLVTTGGSGNLKHAYIVTPAGWTIVEASAVIEGDSKFFNVTHTCPGEPVEEPTTEAPTSDAPTSEAPTSDAPTSDAPTSDEPTSDAPTSDAPTSDAPTSDAPTSDAPTSDAPSSDAPTSEPETSTSPAESSPAESSPAESSSAAPSSEAPSSEAPSSSTPVQASTSPAGSALPTTGSSLTYVLAGAGALLLAGIVLLVLMRRRAESTEGA